MIRALTVLIAQRLLLFCVAMFVLNHAPQMTKRQGKKVLEVSNVSAFLVKVGQRPEAKRLLAESKRPTLISFERAPEPFVLIFRLAQNFLNMDPVLLLLILTNVFFICFLFELHSILSRFVPPGTAAKATTLVVLLPTSFELSLIAGFSLTCFLVMVVIRNILDNRWAIAGVLYGILILIEPLIVAMLPLLIYVFVYYQRHFFVSVVAKRALVFLLPAMLAALWNIEGFREIQTAIDGSSWRYLWTALSEEGGTSRTLLHSPLGTTIVVVLLLIGGIAATLYNTTIVHKLVPLYTLFYLLFSSPFEELGTRAILGGLCMEGVALVSGKPAIVTVHLLLLALAMFETAWAFKVTGLG